MFKEKTFSLHLVEDDIDTLLCGLRYLEFSHPNKDYKPLFKQLLNIIYSQVRQTELFPKMSNKEKSII